jgi:manganese/zinc/iron transport system substrate-binding protein
MKKQIIFILIITVFFGCKNEKKSNGKLNVVTTTSMITDLVKNIAGDYINLQGLMGSGVDPHLYKASEGDVSKLFNADIIFYNGLHLEGKLVEVFEKMKTIKTIAISDALDKNTLIGSEYFASNYDPHIWFNIDYWIQATAFIVNKLSEVSPEQKDIFEANGNAYIKQLEALKSNIINAIETLPEEKRILVTAHDAFNYFGKSFGFEVVGLQGISTATEAGVQDVQKLSSFIIKKNVKAIFVESSVPKRTIEALQAAVNSKGHAVSIGGSLYSDALGNAGTVEGTYIGMFKYNVNTIVNALK